MASGPRTLQEAASQPSGGEGAPQRLCGSCAHLALPSRDQRPSWPAGSEGHI